MGLKEQIKSYIVLKGWNITKLASELNRINGTELTTQNLSKKINSETLKYKEVLQIAEILGYKIEWISQD